MNPLRNLLRIFTYGNNEYVEKIPKIREVFDESKTNQLDEEFHSENNCEEIIAIFEKSVESLLLLQMNIFKHLRNKFIMIQPGRPVNSKHMKVAELGNFV